MEIAAVAGLRDKARANREFAEAFVACMPAQDDVFACTHTWWGANGPAEDPLGSDASALHASREKLLSFATVIVPGHGAAFRPDQSTPR